MIDRDPQADFCIKIDYVKGSRNPARVFQTMSRLIEACNNIDRSLIKSIDSKIEPVLLLEDVETSSIKAWLRQVVESIEDDDLKSADWKAIVGTYLVKGKYYVVDFLRDKTEISNIREIAQLEDGLQKLAEETDVKHLPFYRPVDRQMLLRDISEIAEALDSLEEGDRASYITQELEAPFNLELSMSPETINELVTAEVIPGTFDMILKIKTAEFLSEAQWEFKHGDSPIIRANILDHDWLRRYLNREIPLLPGDSLRVHVSTKSSYDHNHNLIGIKYDIIKVYEKLSEPETEQPTLPLDEPTKEL